MNVSKFFLMSLTFSVLVACNASKKDASVIIGGNSDSPTQEDENQGPAPSPSPSLGMYSGKSFTKIQDIYANDLILRDGVIYAGSNNGLYKSIDKGVSFEPVPELTDPVLSIDIQSSKILYTGGDKVYFSENSGQTFNQIDVDGECTSPRKVGLHGSLIMIMGLNRFCYSSNGGQSFTTFSATGPGSSFFGFQIIGTEILLSDLNKTHKAALADLSQGVNNFSDIINFSACTDLFKNGDKYFGACGGWGLERTISSGQFSVINFLNAQDPNSDNLSVSNLYVTSNNLIAGFGIHQNGQSSQLRFVYSILKNGAIQNFSEISVHQDITQVKSMLLLPNLTLLVAGNDGIYKLSSN